MSYLKRIKSGTGFSSKKVTVSNEGVLDFLKKAYRKLRKFFKIQDSFEDWVKKYKELDITVPDGKVEVGKNRLIHKGTPIKNESELENAIKDAIVSLKVINSYSNAIQKFTEFKVPDDIKANYKQNKDRSELVSSLIEVWKKDINKLIPSFNKYSLSNNEGYGLKELPTLRNPKRIIEKLRELVKVSDQNFDNLFKIKNEFENTTNYINNDLRNFIKDEKTLLLIHKLLVEDFNHYFLGDYPEKEDNRFIHLLITMTPEPFVISVMEWVDDSIEFAQETSNESFKLSLEAEEENEESSEIQDENDSSENEEQKDVEDNPEDDTSSEDEDKTDDGSETDESDVDDEETSLTEEDTETSDEGDEEESEDDKRPNNSAGTRPDPEVKLDDPDLEKEEITKYLSSLMGDDVEELKIFTAKEVNRPLYHVSMNSNIKMFTPKVSNRTLSKENRSVPRISTSTSLVGCFNGYQSMVSDMDGRKVKNFGGLYRVYELPYQYAIKPSKKILPDVNESDEYWITSWKKETYATTPNVAADFVIPKIENVYGGDGTDKTFHVYIKVSGSSLYLDHEKKLDKGYYYVVMKGYNFKYPLESNDLIKVEEIDANEYNKVSSLSIMSFKKKE